MELKVTLDFACYSCAETVHVTLQCSGSGLSARSEMRATVNVPCPTCGAVNCVEFEPSGAVHAVRAVPPRRATIEPSIN